MKKKNVTFKWNTPRVYTVTYSTYASSRYRGYAAFFSALFWSVIGPTDRYNSLYFAYRHSYATGY